VNHLAIPNCFFSITNFSPYCRPTPFENPPKFITVVAGAASVFLNAINTGKGKGYAATRSARLAANSLK